MPAGYSGCHGIFSVAPLLATAVRRLLPALRLLLALLGFLAASALVRVSLFLSASPCGCWLRFPESCMLVRRLLYMFFPCVWASTLCWLPLPYSSLPLLFWPPLCSACSRCCGCCQFPAKTRLFFRRLLSHVDSPRHGVASCLRARVSCHRAGRRCWAPASGAAALAGFLFGSPSLLCPILGGGACVQTRIVVLHPRGASHLGVSLTFPSWPCKSVCACWLFCLPVWLCLPLSALSLSLSLSLPGRTVTSCRLGGFVLLSFLLVQLGCISLVLRWNPLRTGAMTFTEPP